MTNPTNGSQEQPQGEESILSLRSFSFLFIALITCAAVYFQKTKTEAVPEADMGRLQAVHGNAMLRLIMTEALVANQYPAEQKKQYIDAIVQQLETLNQQSILPRETVEVQKRMLQAHLGAPPVAFTGSGSDLEREFQRLYIEGQPLANEAALFRLPTGDLARVKQYRLRNETAKARDLESRLEQDAVAVHMKLLGGVFLVAVCLGGGFFVVLALFVKSPLALYGPVLDLIPPRENRVLLETTLLYLFFMFPLGGMLAGLVPAEWRLAFHILFLPTIMGLALYYFASNTSPGVLKLLLFGEAPRPVLLAREIGYGVLGFLAVFPFAALVLGFFLTVVMYLGGQEGNSAVRFAHPVVFEIGSRPALIFALAVAVVPLIEEIVFRGLLYGFFRKQSGNAAVQGSFGRLLLAGAGPGFLSGFLFALLHPQGWPAIPYLTLLGMGLCYVRELRPTIIAPTVAHALVNALAVLLSWWVLG